MVTSEQRAPVLPDVPSAVEAGFRKVNVKYWLLGCSCCTPQDIVDKLNRDTTAALAQEDTKKDRRLRRRARRQHAGRSRQTGERRD